MSVAVPPAHGGHPPLTKGQVAHAVSPILCSKAVANTPLRSPGAPVSGSNKYLGTRNRLSPLVPAGAPTGSASSRWAMFSNRSSESPEVMNRLTPSMCQVPSC